jgi:cytoskeletal protein RodZ
MSSFGEELRRERELRQITLREVSEATKINLRYLEALESNDFEHLPGGVFNRGFVRAYSQFIGIDPDSMVDAYRLEEQAQATVGTARDRHSFHRPRRKSPRPDRPAEDSRTGERRAGRPWLWVLVLLVVAVVVTGALLLYFKRGGEEAAPGPPAGAERSAVGVAESRA